MSAQDATTRKIQENEERALLHERLNRLSDQVQSLESRLTNYERELASVKTRLDQITATATGAAAAEVKRLQDQLASLDKARQQDRQVILDEVAKQLETIAKRSGKNTAPTASHPTKPALPASGSSAPAQPAPASGDVEQGLEHVVKAGETISAIAKAYNVGAEVIMKANNIKDARTLQVGQKLFIPKK